jgi:hypothetical protein
MNYVNRYMNQTRLYQPDSKSVKKGEIRAAMAFNDYVNSIFKTDQPKLDNTDAALNYYVERMNDKKAERQATRSSAMIPVSVNFKTDGIAGFAMGHAFTLPKELLPRTYERFEDGLGKRVGFVVVGLDHTITNNVWDTDVKANMYFMKEKDDFYTSDKFFATNLIQQAILSGEDAIFQPSGPPGGSTVGCEKLKIPTADEANKTYPRSTKWQRGTSPVIVNPSNPPTYRVNLDALQVVQYSQTIVTPQQYITAAEKIINSLAPSATGAHKKQILISAYAISRAEQGGPNGGFKGFNNNISGIESSGFKVYSANDVAGKVTATEGGTNKKKFYYAFTTLSAGLVPPITNIMNRNMFSPSGDPEEWAWRWYRDWNGYGARDKQPSDCANVGVAIAAYKTAKSYVDRYTTFA